MLLRETSSEYYINYIAFNLLVYIDFPYNLAGFYNIFFRQNRLNLDFFSRDILANNLLLLFLLRIRN